ncbi:MAG: pantetheine-phosphate adenylyltransferase [Gammaproteobacteria bacterium]|nr:pantetheine-phosphate adenylyltransferase [Gammaproteobacteria bacterium]
MKVTAIYPGTFDPITNGHTDIVARAASLFDRIIVAIARSTTKTTAFTTEERVEMARRALTDIRKAEVRSFDGLMISFAEQQGARVVIRGLRAVSDFDYEFQMAGMNRQLNNAIETVFLTPAEHLGYISSSLVREIAALGGDVSQFVHPEVKKALKHRLSS